MDSEIRNLVRQEGNVGLFLNLNIPVWNLRFERCHFLSQDMTMEKYYVIKLCSR